MFFNLFGCSRWGPPVVIFGLDSTMTASFPPNQPKLLHLFVSCQLRQVQSPCGCVPIRRRGTFLFRLRLDMLHNFPKVNGQHYQVRSRCSKDFPDMFHIYIYICIIIIVFIYTYCLQHDQIGVQWFQCLSELSQDWKTAAFSCLYGSLARLLGKTDRIG